MYNIRLKSWGIIHNTGIALVLALLTFCVPQANAVPFTDNFDALIADMQSRASALSNSTDKVQQKQYKSLVSVLKTLNGKTSTSLATDIKNLGTVVKTLIKSFPTDFTPPGGSLLTNTETALDGLIDNVQTSINTTTTNFNALVTSSCKTKAQTTVDTAQFQLDATSAATNITTAAKLLGTALKTELKTDKAVTKCSSVTTGGGGGGSGNGLGDTLSARVSGSLNLNFSAVMGPNGIVFAGQYHPVNIITIEAEYAPGGAGVTQQSMILYVDNVTGPGTYPIDFGSQFDQDVSPQISFLGAEGTITFTTADLANQKLIGTFAFTAPEVGSNTEMITVTSGQFNISRMPAIPIKTIPTNTNFMTATDNGFAFWGSCTGFFTTNAIDNKLTIVGENTFAARSISLVLDNPTSTGVPYPVGNGSLYQNEPNGGTFYQGNPSGTVVFSTLDIASGIAEGTFTFSATQTIPPATNTVTVINGHFKNNNIITN